MMIVLRLRGMMRVVMMMTPTIVVTAVMAAAIRRATNGRDRFGRRLVNMLLLVVLMLLLVLHVGQQGRHRLRMVVMCAMMAMRGQVSRRGRRRWWCQTVMAVAVWRRPLMVVTVVMR